MQLRSHVQRLNTNEDDGDKLAEEKKIELLAKDVYRSFWVISGLIV